MLKTKNFSGNDYSVKQGSYSGNIFFTRSIRSNFLTNLTYNGNTKKGKILFFPNKGKMNFELLNVFYTLILCGNVKLASERLAISQPAISLSINKLEKKTGVLLFHQINSKKFITLTSSGIILFNYIQRLFQIIQESIEVANEQNLPISNLNKNNQNNYKLFSILNRNKNFFYPRNKVLNFNIFSGSLKNLPSKKYENLKFFETSSKFLLLKSRHNCSHKLDLSSLYQRININYKKLEVDKLMPINLSNNTFVVYSKDKSLIEIQTATAFTVCLDLEISDLIYWGSEL